MSRRVKRGASAPPPSKSFDLTALPPDLLFAILQLLPPEERVRASLVSKGWRDALSNPALWKAIRLCGRQTEIFAPLRSLAAKAQGVASLSLDLDGFSFGIGDELKRELESITASPSCTALSISYAHSAFAPQAETLAALCASAPHLEILASDVRVDYGEPGRGSLSERVRSALLPRGAVRVRTLSVFTGNAVTESDILEMSDVLSSAQHPTLEGLRLRASKMYAILLTPRSVERLVSITVARSFTVLHLQDCPGMTADCVPPLVHLLATTVSLKELTLDCLAGFLNTAREPSTTAHLFYEAVRDNRTLTKLNLLNVAAGGEEHWYQHPGAAFLPHKMGGRCDVVTCVVGHPTLEEISFTWMDLGGQAARLVAANAPSLRRLSILRCWLSKNDLHQFSVALRSNTHLLELDMRTHMYRRSWLTKPATARSALLPAVSRSCVFCNSQRAKTPTVAGRRRPTESGRRSRESNGRRRVRQPKGREGH